MVDSVDETIAAIASPHGGGLRGVIRMSGDDSAAIAQRCFRSNDQAVGAAQLPTAFAGELLLPAPLGNVPARLFVWPTKRSYTRQPSVEIHTIGSPPILEAALSLVCANGARLARAGEFTLRAFLAGRIDLTQAEAVLGVIDAHTQADLNRALSQLAGGVADPLHEVRSDLLNLLADLEAGLDFVDEDIEFISQEEVVSRLFEIHQRVQNVSQQMVSRTASTVEPRVAFVGKPNAGKSSLINAITGDAVAIVADQPGTTRDFIERRMELGGVMCVLVDTAGQEQGRNEIETAAQIASHRKSQECDVRVVCIASDDHDLVEIDDEPESEIHVATKCDLAPGDFGISTSAKTGQGIDDLVLAIASRLHQIGGEQRVIAGAASRCRESLRESIDSLASAHQAAAAALGDELVAGEIRLALTSLGEVVGVVYTDDVLDRIFSRFCVGK